jgi:ketosteroid isomerase-like protein
VPETKDFAFLDGGYAVAWRAYTASFVTAPGADTTNARGTVLMVLKKLPDGSWKVFRGLGSVEAVK